MGEEDKMAKNNATVDRIQAVWNILGGEQGVDRLIHGELVVGPRELKDFPVWKTIKLGTGLQTADDFRTALKDGGYHIGDWGNDLLGQKAFTAQTEETSVSLVVVSVADLGFKEDRVTRADIYRRAQELGLELCPAEVGPQLRLQYADQPNGEWLLIGMEPTTGSDGVLNLFYVEHDDCGRWLNGNSGYPDSFWYDHHRFVFVHRK